MIFALTKAGIALCAAVSCNGPAGINAALRPLVPDASKTWTERYDLVQHCLDGQPCNLIGGTDCVQIATFTQSDGRTGQSFVCRIRRENPTS